MSDSDSSGLSSAPEEEVKKLAPIFMRAKKATKLTAPPPKVSPPRPKRPPSPPHEETLADNPNIAFIVMFRSRFASAFSSKLAHVGPQDIENGVSGPEPSKDVEGLLCALLGLVLNRKKPVEHGHYGRALEEAVQTQKSQWPLKWQGGNPLHGGRDFNNMSAEDRIYLLRTLVMWSLTSSDAISATIKDSYKQSRHADDENQPLSVQPWGRDGDKRRYFLIEGQEDTHFRVYREASRYTKNAQWYSMAGSIEEVKTLAEKLDNEDGTQFARTLGQRMTNAIPRFESTLEKRQRREYRQARRAAFTRPEPGFSLYEGRTRGKRMRYTFDDEEAFEDSDATSNRRSARQSERNTPAETGPTYTASGRQVKPRQGGEYGASLLSGRANGNSPDELAGDYDSEEPVRGAGRAGRGNTNGNNGKRKRFDDDDEGDMSDEEDAPPSEDGWNSETNGAEDELPDADDAEDEDEEDDEDAEPQSLVVKLSLKKPLTNGVARSSEQPASDASVGNGTATLDTKTSSTAIEEPAQAGASNVTPTSITNGTTNGSPTPSLDAQAQGNKFGYPTPSSLAPAVNANISLKPTLVPQQRSAPESANGPITTIATSQD